MITIGCDFNSGLDNQSLHIHDAYFNGSVDFQSLKSTTGFKFILRDSAGNKLDQIVFKYIPYQLDTGDINHDGKTDILVGLTKTTHFDPVERKRLFIIRIDSGQLRPLWLGTRVCQELVAFKTIEEGEVKTIEHEKNGQYAIGTYAWQGFGLALIKYTHHELSLSEAQKIFENKI